MAKKISELSTPTIPLTGGELFEVSQAGVSTKVTFKQLKANLWTYADVVTTTSGTSHDLITTLPTWVTEIEILSNEVSTDTTNQPPIYQLGDAGGYEITGYVGMARASNGDTPVTDSFRPFRASTYTNTMSVRGTMVIRRFSRDLNIWIASGLHNSSSVLSIFSGQKTTSELLTSIRVTTPGGVATFDAGSIAVRYR